VDVSYLKGRFAEAFVESIFRRAGYQVARTGRESQVQGLIRRGTAEFTPDFLLWRKVGEPNLHRLLAVEVKYRASIPRFLGGEVEELAERVREQWPELYCVIVTDTPENGRSCFQAFTLKDWPGGSGRHELVDLHTLLELDIFPTTVAEYEGLVRSIFGLLNQTQGSTRQPEFHKMLEGGRS
jgi:hypothetical protein